MAPIECYIIANTLATYAPALTPEQEEMRLRGLRILARIIARRCLEEPASSDGGSIIADAPPSDSQFGAVDEERTK